MATVIFEYNGDETQIQCNTDDKFSEICQKFLIANGTKETLYYIYGGKIINEELTFKKIAKEEKSIKDLVENIENST